MRGARRCLAGLGLALAGCAQVLGLADPVEPPADAAPGPDTGPALQPDGAALPDALGSGGDAGGSEGGPVRDVGADTQPADGDVGDAGAIACDLTQPFQNARLLVGPDLNQGSNDATPRLSPNELTLYFWSDRGTDAGPLTHDHLYTATRSAVGGSFGPSTELTTLASSGLEASPSVTASGLTIFFESTRLGGDVSQLFFATRSDLSKPFTGVMPITNVNVSTVYEATPFVRPDGKVLYFSSSAGGNQDIYRTETGSTGVFGPGILVPTLQSTADEYSPVISADELDVMWGSQRGTPQNFGDFDIFYAHRSNPSDGFGLAQNAGTGINSSALDLPGWFSPDYCRLYFESARRGVRELYVAGRPPPP